MIANDGYRLAAEKLRRSDRIFGLIMACMVALTGYSYLYPIELIKPLSSSTQNIQSEIAAIDLEIKKIDWLLQQSEGQDGPVFQPLKPDEIHLD